ncbi:hypothetical protein HGRIS_009290 [Hohenbuehelia grisea]|uniref:non-specific serine/threonine protein kinase n=1 Tax=Hohenbuehelia grisea TaxID=104357 RepID=A0ABR3J133_9AGAR
MATTFLSQHSSNPLDVGSSDVRNNAYLRTYKEAAAARLGGDDPMSSDDLVSGGYCPPEVEQYQQHIDTLFPGILAAAASNTKKKGMPKFVDLDEDMGSEDELLMRPVVDEQATSQADCVEGDDHSEDGDASGDEAFTDEENTIHLKPQEEQEEIEEEIEDLEEAVPSLSEDYKIVDRLGTGTFSSVYKAIDLSHDHWDNSTWNCPASSSEASSRPPGTKRFVAIKRIYVTSNPERIRNEIAILETCRGCRHVSQLITAFRHRDQVVAIMPYHRNDDFREYFRTLPMSGIRTYFRCMFRALRDIHARWVIHRDVKPANFLFDPRSGTGTLCDFGLACRMDLMGSGHGSCLHTPPSKGEPHGRVRLRTEYDIEHVKRMQREARTKSGMASERVGYPDKDTRPHSKANRAGTRGFRAPEVLLKCNDQTGAIDVWSAGIILLSFLTGKFPVLQSNDDIEALMEIAVIIGKRRMEKTATLHSRTFATNVPSVTSDGVTWREFVEKQNPDICLRPSPDHLDSDIEAPRFEPQDVELAFSFLDRLLNPESTHRITPREALYHPFLADPSEPGDDDFFPHPFGEGVCGRLHFRDDVTEEPFVRVTSGTELKDLNDLELQDMEVIPLNAGEGIAIGNKPCEFHNNLKQFHEYLC